MGKGVKIRNTSVNGGMTGRDQTIDKVFAHKGGTTYSTMKTYAPASNPNTLAQQLVRDTFAQTSAGWSNLTEVQRDLWNTEAPNWTGTNIFGSTKPSGKNLYTGCNVALKSAAQPLITVPNNKDMQAVISLASLTKTIGGALTFDYTSDGVGNGETVQLHVSPQMSAGTNSNSKYIILFNDDAYASDSVNVLAEYSAKYGAPIAGKKIFWKIKLVSAGGNVTNHAQGVVIW